VVEMPRTILLVFACTVCDILAVKRNGNIHTLQGSAYK